MVELISRTHTITKQSIQDNPQEIEFTIRELEQQIIDVNESLESTQSDLDDVEEDLEDDDNVYGYAEPVTTDLDVTTPSGTVTIANLVTTTDGNVVQVPEV